MSDESTQFQPTYTLDAVEAQRPLSWMTLRKLLVLLVFMAAVPLMVIELLSSQREQDVELRRARESIDALTDAIAVSNTRLVEGVDQFLLALAASPVIAGNDLQACARYLQRILALQPTYLNFGVIAPDGRLLCEATGHPASFNLGDRGYFQRALEGGGLVVGDYQVGRVTGRPSIAFARPVMTENGVTKGVVYAALDLQALSDNLRAGRAMPGAAVLLVDAGGIVLASSGGDVAHLGRPLADSACARPSRAARWAWWSKKRGAEPRYCAPCVQSRRALAGLCIWRWRCPRRRSSRRACDACICAWRVSWPLRWALRLPYGSAATGWWCVRWSG
jgi:C4-dicarboxylate-specific signal transduction histidine kinase